MIEGIEQLVKNEKKLVSGGNRPLYPDVGSDYLQLGRNIEAIHKLEVYEVDKFVNRLGDYTQTKQLIENFKVSTHCNHYTWYPELLMNSFKKYRPDWHTILMKIKEVIGTENEYEKVKELYAEFEPGRMESISEQLFNDGKGLIVILPFKWTHISNWSDIYEYSVKAPGDVHADGNVIDIDSKNTLIKGKKNKLIATIGLDNIIVVDTDDILLICSKDRTVDIKKILDKLKEKDMKELL